MRPIWLVLFLLVLAGCNGSGPVARAAGSYPGHFEIESVDGNTDPKAIAAEEVKGNLELYITRSKFVLDMKTRHQGFTIGGHWTAQKGRVTMIADSFTFDNPTEEDQKAFGLSIISPESLRSLFGHPFVLDASPDRRKLTGLKLTLGRLIGHFEFERPIPH